MILMNILLFSLVGPGLLASQILDVPATLEHEHFHEDDHTRGKILPFIGISLPLLKMFSHSKIFQEFTRLLNALTINKNQDQFF